MEKNYSVEYSLRAKSCDRVFFNYLKKFNEKNIKIHSIFNKVVNLIDHSGNLITIASKEINNAPATLRLDSEFDFAFLTKNLELNYENNRIFFGNKLEIYLKEVEIWEPNSSKTNPINTDFFKENKKIFDSYFIKNSTTAGCSYFYITEIDNFARNKKVTLISKTLKIRLAKLKKAIINNQEIKNELKNIIGPGLGLTPSGDDFLTGLLAVFYLFPEAEEQFVKLNSTINKIDINTTDISKKMLQFSLTGAIRENILDLIKALTSEKKIEEKTIEKVFAIGSTSGRDIAVGIMTAFEIIIKLRTNKMEVKNVF